MTLMLMIGGPADGHIIDLDMSRSDEVRVPLTDAWGATPPAYTIYRVCKFGTCYNQSTWASYALVHQSVDHRDVDEATMVRLIMEPWRRSHGTMVSA